MLNIVLLVIAVILAIWGVVDLAHGAVVPGVILLALAVVIFLLTRGDLRVR